MQAQTYHKVASYNETGTSGRGGCQSYVLHNKDYQHQLTLFDMESANRISASPSVDSDHSQLLRSILTDIMVIPTKVHDSIQVEIANILTRHGQVAVIEHLFPRYLQDSNRAGYIDVVSTGPIRIGIEVDHSTPRTKSILKLNHFNGTLSIIVLKGGRVSWNYKAEETIRRCKMFTTRYVVINLNEGRIMFASPGLSLS